MGLLDRFKRKDTRASVVRQFKKESKEKSQRFQDKNKIPPMQMKVVDTMACVVTIIARFQWMWPKLPNHLRKDFARTLWNIKEMADEHFPEMTRCGVDISDACIMCDLLEVEGDDKEPCTHRDALRLAMLAMAIMKVHPEFDLGETPDEMPDPNEGMIPS